MSIIWQKALAGQTVVQECPGNLRNGKRHNSYQLTRVELRNISRQCLSNMSKDRENCSMDSC